MINFQNAKKLLVPLLIQRGYSKRPDKSSAGHLVMQNQQGQTRILRPNPRGEFDYYYNPGDDSDFGDTVQFLSRELFGTSAKAGSSRLTRPQYIQLERAISAIDPAVNITEHTPESSNSFDLSQHDLRTIGTLHDIPAPDLYLLQQRGIPPEILLKPRFSQSLQIKSSVIGQKEYRNLLFVWRDAAATVVGGQYKYIKEGVCYKHFLAGTSRGTSLWYSDLTNADKLLVCEDPLDALAHHLLFDGDNNNYAYAATGGRVTARQIALLYWLSDREGLQVVLGNDNDTAGAIANLRVADRWGSVSVDHDSDRGLVTVTRSSTSESGSETSGRVGGSVSVDHDSDRGLVTVTRSSTSASGSETSGRVGDILFAGSEQSFALYVSHFASQRHTSIEAPTSKDWNADLHP